MTNLETRQRPPTLRALAAERTELQERDAAATDPAALVAYQAKWQRRLRRLQRAAPARWRVVGLSDEEVRDRLTLRLIEAVLRPAPAELELSRAGREWGLLIATLELRALRRGYRLRVEVTDASEIVADRHAPNQEEQWLEDEAEQGRLMARARAEPELSRPQRRWLQALEQSAAAGSFFQASGEPNLSAAARILGKNRSSAQRGYRELQLCFTRALERLR